MSAAKKRKCHFLDEYTKEWSFIKKGRTDEEALCVICNCFLSVTHGGKADVKHHISTTNHKKKLFAIPAHNATVERVFSLMSAQWTDERNRLLPETMESILQCQVNYKMTCAEFYKYVKGEKELLKKAKSSEKYGHPSTSAIN